MDDKSFRNLLTNDKDFKEIKSDKYNPYENNSQSEHLTSKGNYTSSSYAHAPTEDSPANNLSQHLWRPLVTAQEYLFYFQNGVPHKTIRKLRSGKIRIEAVLDLHQKNKEQSAILITNFIKNSYANELRCISVIHGKGHRTAAQHPILKNLINHWLHDFEEVLGFCSCPPHMGGSGAVLVLLKSNYIE
jgi:DNA-nicking Smr family endonuclease